MTSTSARCSEHDLALDPNGQCVLCRRAEGPARRAGSWVALKVLFGVLLVALASATVYRALERARPLLAAPPAPVRVAEPAEEPAEAPPVEPLRPRSRRATSTLERDPPSPAPHESDAPAPPSAAPAPSEPDRHALLAARRRVRITMYSTSWCGYCRRARAYMTSEGIAFVEHDVEQDARAAQQMRALNPRGGVPTFDIDGTVQVGFSPQGLDRAIDDAARRHL